MSRKKKRRSENHVIHSRPAVDSISIGEACALREIELGFLAPIAQPDQIAAGAARAGHDEEAIARAASGVYRAATAGQRARIQGIIELLQAKASVALSDCDAVRNFQLKQRRHTLTRRKKGENGRMAAIDYFNRGKFWVAGGVLIFLGMYALQAIVGMSGDMSAAADPDLTSTDPSTSSSVLRAGSFVAVCSMGAYALEVLYSTLGSDKAKNIFLRAITGIALSLILCGAVLFSIMYAGGLGTNQADPLGTLTEDGAGGAFTAIAPIALIAIVIVAEAFAAGSMWIRADAINDSFHPVDPIDTPEQIQFAEQRAEHESDIARVSVLVIDLKSIEAEIEAAEVPFVNEYRTAYQQAIAELEKSRAVEHAEGELERAQAGLRRAQSEKDIHRDPGLFKFRNTGGVG